MDRINKLSKTIAKIEGYTITNYNRLANPYFIVYDGMKRLKIGSADEINEYFHKINEENLYGVRDE